MTDIDEDKTLNTANSAADLIRRKLANIYTSEPDVVQETIDSAAAAPKQRSKHQLYMYDLSISGKPFAEIQTAWHAYYTGLGDSEKHQVWQEFYAAHQHKAGVPPKSAVYNAPSSNSELVQSYVPAEQTPVRTVGEIKKHITGKVNTRGKLTKKQHFQSLAFGLSMGAIVVLILLFGFFNERFIAPFITPSRTVTSTPLILGSSSSKVSGGSKVIIPKINLEVPVVYDVPTIEEHDVQKGLERGTLHYATTPNPGEKGNAVIFGHSSNNILNHGKYKFAFVLLNRVQIGDTFYLQKDGIRYIYKVFDRRIVRPTDVSALDPTPGKLSTATLITCDPPGSSINRLIVTGEQISPNPNKNKSSTALAVDQTPDILAGNAESLWQRLIHSIF